MSPAQLDSLPLTGSPESVGTVAARDGTTGFPAPSPSAAGQSADALNTVGLALLAYGLVQLLSKIVDRLPLWRGGGHEAAAAGLTADDRKRLERLVELAALDHDRVQRIAEEVREIHEYTRWANEQRHRVDARDGEPIWQCRARSLNDQLAVNQRLIGQALDELREMQAKMDNVLRKLRALWIRVGQRRSDKR